MIEELNRLTNYPFVNMRYAQSMTSFTVKQNRSNSTGSIFSFVIFGSTFVLVLFSRDILANDGDMSLALSLFFVLTILSAAALLHSLRWKLTVSEDTLSLRRMIGKEESYSIKSITRIERKGNSIAVCIGEKKIKVARSCVNFPKLMALLGDENIPFH